MTAPRIEIARPRTFKNESHERSWHEKRAKAQHEADEAWSKYPPGTKMHVSAARGLTRRARGGVVFNMKSSTEVLVVDLYGEALEKRQQSEAVVSPLGAAAIVADDSLIVHGGPRTRSAQVAADDEAAKLREENARLKADLARARDAASSAPSDGRPQRLGKSKPEGDAGDKADDGKDKPKG